MALIVSEISVSKKWTVCLVQIGMSRNLYHTHSRNTTSPALLAGIERYTYFSITFRNMVSTIYNILEVLNNDKSTVTCNELRLY